MDDGARSRADPPPRGYRVLPDLPGDFLPDDRQHRRDHRHDFRRAADVSAIRLRYPPRGGDADKFMQQAKKLDPQAGNRAINERIAARRAATTRAATTRSLK